MNFKVYKSSAGSGKTYTLVKEYLKLALSSENSSRFKQILAITFTNKAAAEMKERIVRALQALSETQKMEGTNTFLQQDLLKELQLTEEELKLRCSNTLNVLLHDYADFNVSTIDKFTYGLIKTFAFDLKLPLHFDVDLDEKGLIKRSIALIIARAGSDEELTKVLVAYARERVFEEKDWQIENDLFAIGQLLLDDHSDIPLQTISTLSLKDFVEIRKVVMRYVYKTEEQFKIIGNSALELIEKEGLSEECFAYSDKGIARYFSNLKNAHSDKLKPNKNVEKTIQKEDWHSAKADNQERITIAEIRPALLTIYEEAQRLIEKEYEKHILFKLVSKNSYGLSLLNEIQKMTQQIKAEEHILTISDFNRKISEVVLKEPAPFIYERIGEYYKNYLIDEFQDTSVRQWHNLLPLFENALATQNFNLLVGDAKQSIYRFRGGEVDQFITLPALYKHNDNPILLEKEEVLERNFRQEVLAFNYRSGRNIVEFNNAFFDFVKVFLPENKQKIYEEVAQKVLDSSSGGGIKISLLEEEKEDYNQAVLDEVLQNCREVLADGYHLSEIAIITSKREEAVLVSQYLIENGLEVLSEESLLVGNSKKVQLVVYLLYLLRNKNSRTYRAKCVELFSKLKLVNKDLFEITEAIFMAEDPFVFLDKLGFHFDEILMHLLPLYELVEELIRVLGFDKEVDVYLQFFLDVVYQFGNKKGNDLHLFLEYWVEEQKKSTIRIPDGTNAIMVMTIHKAKGLEFPVVVFPFADREVKHQKKYLWTPLDYPELEKLPIVLLPLTADLKDTSFANFYQQESDDAFVDLINVLYVALTRPKDRMYVIAKEPKTIADRPQNIAQLLVAFIEAKQLKKTEGNYLIGCFDKNVTKETKELKSLALNNFISVRWREKAEVSLMAPDVWDVEDQKDPVTYGNLIHKILAGLSTKEELHQAIENVVIDGYIDREKAVEIETDLKEVLSDSRIATYFENEYQLISAETSILMPNGETYIPDRVVGNNEETIIIDYKTGQELPVHQEQLKRYISALIAMDYKKVSGRLVYLKEKKVVLVNL